MAATKPLAGLKIADFSMVYAGPICARMLSDNGAAVTKIEPLGIGDSVRANSRIFSHFNAGKKSIQINLSSAQGQDLAHKLIDDSDVVIENYRPGVMARFGLDYASIKDRCPRIVYCSISGFGQTGPDAQRAAYAPIAHAASGYDISHMRAQLDDNPRPPASGVMIADMLTGAYAYGAIQTALLGRMNSGRGDYIDITMLESTMMLIPGQQQMAQISEPPKIGGFQPVAASDGYVMLCIVSEKNFNGLCAAIDRPDMLADERFARGKRFLNMAEFVAEIEIWSALRNVAECERVLNQHGVPCSRYNAPADLFNQPQLAHRAAFRSMRDGDGAFMIQNVPFQFESFDNSTSAQSPDPGQHTDWVLEQQLHLDATTIAALRANGVVQ
ncbi:MAG: CaiB/BaiF CoA-transferase family protein [Proteobacteria bacterium]|nr:CaiB/BaiF CoA-transferase family protein [Pseudomonadota bacterium]